MARSIIIVLIAIVCGCAAAVGVFQTISKKEKEITEQVSETKPVVIAAQSIARGEVISEAALKIVDWPVSLLPDGILSSTDDVVDQVATVGIVSGEPIFSEKLVGQRDDSFFASIIEPGMRAYTIQTKGPSSSVAGFVRPGNKVDVLLNLRGASGGDSGGGSTTTLLQAVEIMAIDQILDANVDRLRMWAKGDKLASVTLSVTLEQAKLLSLGQSYGELSLALRNGADSGETDTHQPATIQQIRELLLNDGILAGAANAAKAVDNVAVKPGDGVAEPPAPSPRPKAKRSTDELPPPPTYIRTLRGSQPGRIQVVSIPSTKKPEK